MPAGKSKKGRKIGNKRKKPSSARYKTRRPYLAKKAKRVAKNAGAKKARKAVEAWGEQAKKNGEDSLAVSQAVKALLNALNA